MLRFPRRFDAKSTNPPCERRATRHDDLQPADFAGLTMMHGGRPGVRDRQSLPPTRQFLPGAPGRLHENFTMAGVARRSAGPQRRWHFARRQATTAGENNVL
jgi:hypothetical protein